MVYKCKLKISKYVIESRVGTVFSEIKGTTQMLGVAYAMTPVFLIKDSRIIQQTTSDISGSYVFKSVIKGQPYTVFSRDLNRKYNAVIQDNVVPK